MHDPANCNEILKDPAYIIFGYDGHYCGVDDARNATLLACSYFRSGIRVFDIRDPSHPKEIAYYKPPAQRMEILPGSQLANIEGDRTTDWATARIRFRKHRGEKGEKDRGEIWFTTQDNGFQIVRFTNGVGSARCMDPGPRGCANNDKN